MLKESIENSATDPRIEFLKDLLERVQKNRQLIEQKMEAEKMTLELKEDHEIWLEKKIEELSSAYGKDFVNSLIKVPQVYRELWLIWLEIGYGQFYSRWANWEIPT